MVSECKVTIFFWSVTFFCPCRSILSASQAFLRCNPLSPCPSHGCSPFMVCPSPAHITTPSVPPSPPTRQPVPAALSAPLCRLRHPAPRTRQPHLASPPALLRFPSTPFPKAPHPSPQPCQSLPTSPPLPPRKGRCSFALPSFYLRSKSHYGDGRRRHQGGASNAAGADHLRGGTAAATLRCGAGEGTGMPPPGQGRGRTVGHETSACRRQRGGCFFRKNDLRCIVFFSYLCKLACIVAAGVQCSDMIVIMLCI